MTDAIIEVRTGYGFYESWWFEYGAYALTFAIGRFIPRRNYGSIVAGSVAAAIVFFLVSNFGVWLTWPATYPHTIAGLADCYARAIPFARGTFAGDVVFSLVFFGLWNAVVVPARDAQTVRTSGTL